LKKLYVGNLPWRATDAELRDFFGAFGTVNSVTIVTDRETGRSRGFAFVEMDDEGASKAIGQADNRDFGGRAIRVSEARERQPRSGGGDRGGFGDRGGRGGRGGYGGGRSGGYDDER
jgi:RNA recognition motif-containing protein